ncbi:hypothetical protein [uncultured Mediterranean phage uvMED]|nr:hypothetical protein [uncultured Mediterranean phage uvMED]
MVRKKSKFKHISISNKKYYFYSIKFSDPTGDSGWHSVNDIKKFEPSIMVTQAYVFSKDKNFVKTFASHDAKEEVFGDVNVFPIGCIKEMKKIEI